MKEINIFEIVPENFFIPLSSQGKTLYIKIISLIYKLVQNGLSYGIDKDIIVDEIEEYLGLINYDIENDEDEQLNSNREKANYLIRKLINYGWIYPEQTNDYKQIINFHDYTIVILEAFLKIVSKESLEYQGNIISIYSMLYSNEKAGVVIKQVFENTKGIISGLKNLNSNIKKYMDRLTKQKTPEEIMQEFFGNYTKEVIDKAYHRLKTSENVSKYRPKIIERLNESLNSSEFLNEAGEFYREDEELGSLDEGVEKVKDIIHNIINAFNELDDIMHDIDSKNAKYIRAAVTRAKFLLNNSKDMTGLVKGILEYISNEYKELELSLSADYLEEVTDLFTLYSYGYIDETSLYIANEGKKSFKPGKISTDNLSKEERQRKIDEFKKRQEKQYSPKKVNEIVDELLGEKKMILASDIEINGVDDFIKIIYIRLYGNHILAKYCINRKDGIVSNNGFTFKNFEIWRK